MQKAHVLPNEARLIEQVLAGNQAAFGDLVRAYQSRLFHSVLHLVPCAADAEDVVQEAFVQAYTHLDSFRGHSSFYTWLYRIAINTALTAGRRRRKRLGAECSQELIHEEPHDPSGGPEEGVVRCEDAQSIEQALRSLSEEYRAILIMRGVEGFDYATIGDVLGLNPGTVRSRLHRARAQLKKELELRDVCSG